MTTANMDFTIRSAEAPGFSRGVHDSAVELSVWAATTAV